MRGKRADEIYKSTYKLGNEIKKQEGGREI